MNTVTEAFLNQKQGKSRSAQVKSRLGYPVIDTDFHTNTISPLLEDYLAQYGGARIVDDFRAGLKKGFGLGAAQWYAATPQERIDNRLVRPPFWALPAENSGDLAIATLPSLLYERLQEQGSDYAVLYPNLTLFAPAIGREDLRRALSRALNHFHADLYRPYADRLTPVAVLPLHTPQEGIEEVEFAVKELGLKTAIIPGSVRRPIGSLAARYPIEDHPELANHLQWQDFFGIDSEYDYDPFWAKVIELGINPTTHSSGMGWSARASVSNYMFNHIGHFADASEAFAKALFFGGVTRRFPQLRIGLLEGGAAWGANVYTHLVDRFLKRGGGHVQQYNPEKLNRDLLHSLFEQYGSDVSRGQTFSRDEVAQLALGGGLSPVFQAQTTETDDFARAGIKSVEDIRDRWVNNFYFGTEADDRTVAYAFNTKATPLNAQVNAFYSSDAGHWDVPEISDTLHDTWSLVEEGVITEDNFKSLVFSKPYEFYTANNPDFFKGTAVEAKLKVAR